MPLFGYRRFGERQKSAPASKKTDYADETDIKIEILPIVRKDEDGKSVTSAQTPVGSITIKKIVFDFLRIGQLRARIANHVWDEKVSTYREGQSLNFGKHSAVFYSKNHKIKEMSKIDTSEELHVAVGERAAKSGQIKNVNKRKVLTIRIALGAKKGGDEKFSIGSVDEEDQVTESQHLVYASPVGLAKRGASSKRAASTSVDVDTEALITKLYGETASPYYHAFTRQMAASIRIRCNSKDVVDNINQILDDGGWPSPEDVWGDLLGDEVIEKGSCPPYHGQPPSAEVVAARKPLKTETPMQQLLDAVLQKRAGEATVSASGQGQGGPLFFRFRRGDSQVCVEVEEVEAHVLRERASATAVTFTGKDVWDAAKNKDKNNIFKVTKSEGAKIQDKKAGVFVKLPQHANLELTREGFWLKTSRQMLKYFVGDVKGLDLDLAVVDFEEQDEGDYCDI